MLRTINNIIIQSQSVATANYFKELFTDGPIKFFTCVGTTILGAMSSFFLPIWITILSVNVLTIIDMILGIRVSILNGIKPQSRKLWSTIKKLGWSTMIISCAHLTDTFIIPSINTHLVEAFAGMIAGVELWSIVENLHTLDPTGPWRIFEKFIKSKGEKYLDITIDKKDLPKVKTLVKKIK